MQPESDGGVYPADRAAALSGVPKSTVHYWARHGILVPSVSHEKVKLWSFDDLLKLRTIYWLRRPKAANDGPEIPPTTMKAVRDALAQLDDLNLPMWEPEGPRVLADRAGRIVIKHREGTAATLDGQTLLGVIDLLAPFSVVTGVSGPDLVNPRQHLRIIKGKLAGAPHIQDTRIETQAIAALARRGFELGALSRLYPHVAEVAIEEAIDLEAQLARNLSAAA